jgi:DNA uptake protein ComE-like DNA-binding protein
MGKRMAMSLLSWKDFKNGVTAESLIPVKEEEIVEKEVVEECPENNPLQKLNEATEEDLCQIKGIGQKTAQKIISSIPYTTISDIPVSEKLAQKIANWLNS